MFKNNKNLNFLILVILLIILLLIFSTLSNIVYIDIIRKFSFETDIVKKYEINSNSVFCLDKIFIRLFGILIFHNFLILLFI